MSRCRLSAPRLAKLLLVAAAIAFLCPDGADAAGVSGADRGGSKHVQPADVQLGANRLQQWYNTKTGLWDKWWNSANSLTVLVDFSRATHTQAYYPVFENTFAQKAHEDFLNGWYDDEGWWALAWIDAYDLTGKPEYLAMGKKIFADMTGGWDETCGGGIWWIKKRKYKNAIANELFLSVAAHLANRSEGAERVGYLDWANREWKWFAGSGMIENDHLGDHLISDGLDDECHDNHKDKWTYNQGVILGGLAELARATGDQSLGDQALLGPAQQIADAAMEKMADGDGVLHEKCEPGCSGDGKQFKGIFMRNLAALDRVERDRSARKRIERFIKLNARSILNRDQTPDHGFGQVWSGPVGRDPAGRVDAVTQTAAMDALVADLELKSKRKK
jgi:predicted alpha-1,6-mannanase (GH76 family)